MRYGYPVHDRREGRVPRAPDASANFAQPWSFYVLKLSQPLHFGDDGGLPLQIIWALLDIASIIVLAWLMLGKRRPCPVLIPFL